MRRAASVAVALIALAACGKNKDSDQQRPVRPAPRPRVPVAPPAPKMLPTYLPLDEIHGHQPTLTGVRMTTEVALDASGKQAIGNGCVTATGAKVAMHAVADAYGVARWQIRTRATSQADARGEVIASYPLADGVLHVRGVLEASSTCKPDEVGLTLYYTKAVDAPAVAPSTGTPAPAGALPAAP